MSFNYLMQKIKYGAQSSLLGLCFICFFCSISQAEIDPSKKVAVAKINHTVVTLEDFENKYNSIIKSSPLKPITKLEVLDNLIKREVGIQEAKRLGLDRDPEAIDRMNTVLYQFLIEKKLSKEFETIHISDEQAKIFYEKNPEIRTSHIFVSVIPHAEPAQQKKAYEKIKKVLEILNQNQMGFAEAAQKYSEDPTAIMGGDMGYQHKERLEPNYYTTALGLKTPGKISSIIQSPFGYYIIKLTAIRRWEETDQAYVKRQVFEEQKNNIFANYMKQLEKKAQLDLHPELLQK